MRSVTGQYSIQVLQSSNPFYPIYISSVSLWLNFCIISPLMERGIVSECFIYYRKSILQITQPSQYRCTQLQYKFAVISEAPSWSAYNGTAWYAKSKLMLLQLICKIIYIYRLNTI